MILSYVIVLTVLAGAVFIISAPLRAARGEVESEDRPRPVAGPGGRRDAKYHEIRDAELDLRTGKLSDEDYEAVDQALRAEAVEIMHALDAAAPAGAGIRAGE